MAGVMNPGQRRGLLDQVAQGVAIARDVYGIKNSFDENRRREEAAAAEKAEAKQKDDDYASGKLNKGQQVELAAKGFVPVKEGTPGAFSFIDKDSGLVTWVGKLQEPAKTPLVRQADPIAERKIKLDEQRFAYQKERDAASAAERKAAQEAKQAAPVGQAPAIKLNAEERKRLDSASMGLAAVKDMGDALASGTNTFSLIGDNDFTAARMRFEEAIGRMQSGGAINNDEAARFRKMAPTFSDSDEMQQKKIAEIYREMALRVKSLGANPDDVLANRGSVSVPDFAPKEEGVAIADTPKKGRVFVSNGKETLEIDAGDVEAAKADGYQVVGGRN